MNGEIPGSCGLVPEMTAMISQMANLRAALVAAIGGAAALRACLIRPQARSLASARQAPAHWRCTGQVTGAAGPAAAHQPGQLVQVHYFRAGTGVFRYPHINI